MPMLGQWAFSCHPDCCYMVPGSSHYVGFWADKDFACSYNTYNQHYKEVQCFQGQVEPLLYKYGANFVFFGQHSDQHTSTPEQLANILQ